MEYADNELKLYHQRYPEVRSDIVEVLCPQILQPFCRLLYAHDSTVLHWKRNHFVLLYGQELPDIKSIFDPDVVLRCKRQAFEQLRCYKMKDPVFLVLGMVLHSFAVLVRHNPDKNYKNVNYCQKFKHTICYQGNIEFNQISEISFANEIHNYQKQKH